MTWPTGPPPMPAPGWYDDPEQASTWRWWDGASWTDHRAPMWVPPPRDMQSFSFWFERSAAAVWAVTRRVGLLVFGAWAGFGLAAAVVLIAALESGRGQELRRLLDLDIFTIGPADPVTLTDAEADRVVELLGELFWAVLPWAFLLTAVALIVTAWSFALVAQTAARTSRDGDVDDAVDERAGLGDRSVAASARAALRRTPAVLLSSLALGALALGVLVVLSVPVLVLLLADAGGGAIGLTVFFCVVAGLVVGVWLVGRLGLAVVIAALGDHGLGIRRSWNITHGRIGFVLGRLIVAALIAGAISGSLSLVNNVTSLLGVVVAVSMWFVVNAVVNAVSTIVSVSSQTVILDQLDGTTGSSTTARHT